MHNTKKFITLALIVTAGFLGGIATLQSHTSAATSYLGDINGDGIVNATDMSIVLTNYYKSGSSYAKVDLDGNGKIDSGDLTFLSAHYGKLDPVTEPPQTGSFTTVGSKIYDPTGKEFIPAGANFIGPNMTFDKKTLNYSIPVLKDQWKINTMRINTCMVGGCDYNQGKTITAYHGSDDLDAIVKKYTDAGIVVMIDLHQTPFGGFPADAKKYDASGNVIGTYTGNTSINAMRTWWVATATKYKNNPYVWFDLVNEPGNPKGQGDGAFYTWRDIHKDLVASVRGTGANNIVLVEGTYWGQETAATDGNLIQTNKSAILRFGKEVAGNYKNVAFSIHTYGGWGPTAVTDAVRDNRLADYITRTQALGHPMVIGETGSLNYQYPYDGIVAEYQAKLDAELAKTAPNKDNVDMFKDRIGRIPTETRGTQATYRVATTKGIGVIAFAGFTNKWNDYSMILPGKDASGNYLVGKTYWGDELDMVNINSPTNPTNLNWHGKLLWNFTHR